jgi:hypothetical protein
VPLASTPDCGTQAMYLPKRMISVQGHPEYTDEMAREILGWFDENHVLPQEIIADGFRRLGGRDDGVEVAKSFLHFLEE